MNPESDQRRDRPLETIIRCLSPSGELPQPLTEEDLWDYALGLLEPAQERETLTRIACSEKAKQELARIRSSIAAVAVPGPELKTEAAAAVVGSVRATIEEKIARTLANMEQKLSSLAAVVVRKSDGLLSLFEDVVCGKVTAAVPETASVVAEPTVEPQEKFVIELPEGSRLVIVTRPEGIADLMLETRPALKDGVRATLLQLIEREQEWGWKPVDEVPVTKGTARFADCPPGILRIQISERSFVEFYLTSEDR